MNRFHDNNGWLLVGIDQHMGIHWPTPIPFPCRFWELNVMHPFWMGPNQKPTVQINGGKNTVVDQHWSFVLWPHFPVAPDPLNMLFPLDMLLGAHKTILPRGTVHIEGTPAAITLVPAGGISINMDCWELPGGGVHVPTSIVYQAGTVVTTASWRDYLTAGVRVAIAILMVVLKGKAKGGKPPARPTGIRGWSNVRRATQYMRRGDAAGRRARSTFQNALGRNLMSRLKPKPLQIVFGSPQSVMDGMARSISTGDVGGLLPTPGAPDVMARRAFKPFGGAQGFVESSGQKQWPPPFG